MAFANDPDHPVAVFLAEVGDVEVGGLKDPQAEEPEQADQGEVVGVGRVACGGQHRLELQMRQPQGGRLRRHAWPAHVLSRGIFKHPVDDAGAVEPGNDR